MPTYLSQTKSGIISSHGSRLPNGLAVVFIGLFSSFVTKDFKYLLGLLFNFFDFWCLLQILDSVANSTHHHLEAKMGDEFITFHLWVNYIPRLLRDFHGYQFTKTKIGNTGMNSIATSYCSLGCPKTTVHKHEKVGSTYGLRHQTKASNLDFNFLLTSKHYLAIYLIFWR